MRSGGLKEQAVAGMLWLTGVRLSTRVLDQVFTIVLARLLLPADFGLIAMAAVFTHLLGLFTTMGIGRAVVQRREVDEELLSTAFWGNVGSGLLLTLLGLGGAELIARLYSEPLVRPLFAALSLRFALNGANITQMALLSRDFRYGILGRRNVGSTLLGGAVGLGVAFAGGGVWSLVAQTLASDVARTALLWSATTWRPRRRFSWRRLRELWSFGSRILGAQLFNYVVKQADNLLIGRTLGATLLGFYAFGYAMFLSPLIDISLTVGQVAFSAFSRVQEDLARLQQGFLLTTRYVAFFTFPALVGLFLVADDLVPLLFGEKWRPAVPVLQVLLIAGVLSAHWNIWSSAFQALGRPGWVLAWSVISVAVYVPAFVIGLRFGIVGVAAGYTASTVLLLPFQFRMLQGLLRLSLWSYLRVLLPVLGACLLMGLGVIAFQVWVRALGAPAYLRLTGAVGVGVIVYAAAITVIERQVVVDLLRILASLRRHRAGRLAGEAVS